MFSEEALSQKTQNCDLISNPMQINIGETDLILLSGKMRKRKTRGNTWTERYFKLKNHSLEYYVHNADNEPRGVYNLQHNTVVSKISTDAWKKNHQHFVFKLSTKQEDEVEEKEKDGSSPDGQHTNGKGKSKRKDNPAGTRVAAAAVGGAVLGALTSGVGLLAGMMVVGMGAAAGGAAAASGGAEYKERIIVLGCETYENAEKWVAMIEAQIQEMSDQALGFTLMSPRGTKKLVKSRPHPDVRLAELEDWMSATKWKVFDTYEGTRILEPFIPAEDEIPYQEAFFNAAHSTRQMDYDAAPCQRINLCINASVGDTLSAIMNCGDALKAGVVQSMKIIHTIDNATDIIHLKFHPVFLYPTWTEPRDFCLLRYWRQNSDGCYIILFDSTTFEDCPPSSDFVRGELHFAYVISPPKRALMKEGEDEEANDCMLSFIAQLDPKGWIWSNLGYRRLFLKEFMLQVLDVRDAIESDRYLQVHFDPTLETGVNTMAMDSSPADEQQGTIFTIPPPILPPSMYADPDASTFKVRGSSYNVDKQKKASDPSLFKLIAIDVFEVTEATHNIAAHPKNRVALAAQRGDPSWIFLVNIMVPGPPFMSFVVYMLGDKSLIDADTPFGRVAKPFFYGNDDEFRNNRFKLIPKVIDGNMIIKMAVKDTPTLLGNKLKQYYYKGDNYFELDVDVGSSSVARNVVGLALGYSKNIVVDMGFCLQGNEEDELPEVLMGGCTCIHVDMYSAKKL